ncbi:MAG: hypothetical protein ABJA98_04360 [Acidobacteriota bacterium]
MTIARSIVATSAIARRERSRPIVTLALADSRRSMPPVTRLYDVDEP